MYLMVSDSFNENEHFLNNYKYHKANYLCYNHNMTLLVHLSQYQLHLSEITDTNNRIVVDNNQY